MGTMITSVREARMKAVTSQRRNGMRMGLVLLLAILWAGMQPLRAQTVEYIHTDALGTPVAITNAAGQVIEVSEYEPYGKLLNRPLTDGPGFTGHVQDTATGLTYMQQRYYDPGIGRFLSIDPITVNFSSGENFNRYAYVANNPYTNFDPDGRYRCNASSDDCKQVRIAIRNIQRSAANQQIGTRIPNARSKEISNFYGKEGVDNGVVVESGAPRSAGTAETKGGATTISINFSGLQAAAKNFPGFSVQDLVDSTVLHEGSHGYDQRKRENAGFSPMTKSRHQFLQGERRAYKAESAFYQSMSADSPWGLWTRAGGRNNAEIERQSLESVNQTCGLGRCTP